MFNRSQKNKPSVKHLFLEDRPLKSTSGDKFQYTQVAEVISDLLAQNNFPVHIGLFGPWGSGKTSVIKLLENKIESDSNISEKYLIKTLSVWKFADDAPSLHRKIVRQVQAELGVINDEGITIESTNTDTATGSGIFSLLIKNRFFKVSALIYILILIAVFVVNIAFSLPRVNAILTELTSAATLAIVLGAFKVFLGNFQLSNQITKKNLALQHSDQYEARFEASVEEYLNKNNGKNLILVFDDLDRLPPKQLLAALNTIKTFLHSSNCAFILPCDETVLRNGIRAAFEEKEIIQEEDSTKSEESYVSEFISKTFDYLIHLPIVEQRNMKTYARQLITEQKLSWIDDPDINLNKIMGVLIHTETKTPRQVKSLINSFVANWELAKKRDNESGKKLLTKEPEAIALFTVLQTDYPSYYNSLVNDPYLITRNDNKILKDNNLKGYLSRVEKFIPKDDPRPFIYFSNEKLNPATGKPEVLKVMTFLVNGQVNEFKNAFELLSLYDKEILLSSAISDFYDNSGIEVENCLKSLIESEVDLTNVVSEMELHNWDLLLRENVDYLLDHIPSKVCNVLNYLSYDEKTWMEYGAKLKVEKNSDDLVDLWVKYPSYVEKLGIQDIGKQISNSFIENNDGYSLVQRVFDLNSGHPMLLQIDWAKIVEESLPLNYSPNYSLAACIIEINKKTDSNITADLLNHFLELYGFKTDEFVMGIGRVWCSIYSGTAEEINGFVKLFGHDSFSGFDEEDFTMINSFMEDVSYGEVRDVVNSYLSEQQDAENINKYLETFPNSPGIPGFCEKNFSFNLDNESMKLYLSVIVNRNGNIKNKITNVIDKIKSELDSKSSQQTKSEALVVIQKLQEVNHFGEALTNRREELLPLNDKYMWFNWVEEVFVERLELFFLIYGKDDSALQWLLECVESMTNMVTGHYNPGKSYSNNSSRYLNILVNQIVTRYIDIDWENIISNWRNIKARNNTTSIDLFNYLDSTTRSQVVGQLSNRCSLGNASYNGLLNGFYDLAVNSHREAVFKRWEVIGQDFRAKVIQNLSQQTDEIVIASNKLLVDHLSVNPQIDFLNEFVEWEIKEEYRKLYIRRLIEKMSLADCVSWVSETVSLMNRDGFHRWKGFSVEYAAERGKIDLHLLKAPLETALDLGQERAKMALTVLSKIKLGKADSRYFREKIIKYYNEYPELVNHFGYRFKV